MRGIKRRKAVQDARARAVEQENSNLPEPQRPPTTIRPLEPHELPEEEVIPQFEHEEEVKKKTA